MVSKALRKSAASVGEKISSLLKISIIVGRISRQHRICLITKRKKAADWQPFPCHASERLEDVNFSATEQRQDVFFKFRINIDHVFDFLFSVSTSVTDNVEDGFLVGDI